MAELLFSGLVSEGVLLDDGFQHLQLHRDLNILLVDSTIGFGDHHLLPRGMLREPLSHLRRADLFLLTKVESPEACQPLENLLRKIHPAAPVFHSHYEPSGLIGPNGEWEDLSLVQREKSPCPLRDCQPLLFPVSVEKMWDEGYKRSSFPGSPPLYPKKI